MRKGKKLLAFLFVTHKTDDVIIDRYRNLEESVKDYGDVFFVVQKESGDKKTLPEDINSYIFNIESLNKLGYNPISPTIVPGSAYFVLLQFYKDFPQYDYYWNIEYDVVYTGEWKCFFDLFKDVKADLLASHIKKYNEYPAWSWWGTIKLVTIPITGEKYIKSFNPVYRISNRSLKLLDKVLLEGNSGHYEAFIPTVLNYWGYKLVDFGGDGSYVLDGFEEKCYTSSPELELGTMRFFPHYNDDELTLPNKLYHPVKNIAKLKRSILLQTLSCK